MVCCTYVVEFLKFIFGVIKSELYGNELVRSQTASRTGWTKDAFPLRALMHAIKYASIGGSRTRASRRRGLIQGCDLAKVVCSLKCFRCLRALGFNQAPICRNSERTGIDNSEIKWNNLRSGSVRSTLAGTYLSLMDYVIQ